MSVNMHLRDVPDPIHEELQRRAAEQGMTHWRTPRTWWWPPTSTQCSSLSMAASHEAVSAVVHAGWTAYDRSGDDVHRSAGDDDDLARRSTPEGSDNLRVGQRCGLDDIVGGIGGDDNTAAELTVDLHR